MGNANIVGHNVCPASVADFLKHALASSQALKLEEKHPGHDTCAARTTKENVAGLSFSGFSTSLNIGSTAQDNAAGVNAGLPLLKNSGKGTFLA